MKKVLKWALIIVLILVLGLAALNRKYYLKKHYEPDMVRLETVILQKDSEGRGYSDIVKENIEKEFTDPLVKNAVSKLAVLQRTLVRSNSMEEYNPRLKKYLLQRSCVSFLLYEMNIDTKITSLNQITTDSQEMNDYSKYLNLFRFSTREREYDTGKWMADPQNSIETKSDFDEKCL
jgi:hypothetical protein